MPRRASVATAFLILLAVSLPAAAMELGPPARNLDTFREVDAGYLTVVHSVDRVDMTEKDSGLKDAPHRFSAPGSREVERTVTGFSVAWLPHDRYEMDFRFGLQGMRVGNALEVEGRRIDAGSRLSGLLGGGARALVYDNPLKGLRFGVVADGSVSIFRGKRQRDHFLNSLDNLVSVDLRYAEHYEARLGFPVSKVFRFGTRAETDSLSPRELTSRGGVDSPFPDVTGLEIYGGPFARAAYMHGRAKVRVGTLSYGSTDFNLVQDSPFGFYGGVRAYGGATQRWSAGLEGRYQSGLSFSLLLSASL